MRNNICRSQNKHDSKINITHYGKRRKCWLTTSKFLLLPHCYLKGFSVVLLNLVVVCSKVNPSMYRPFISVISKSSSDDLTENHVRGRIFLSTQFFCL